jgi:2-polyprenyl-3-methyl-5-hydroxy-6-metoxy-1,4-benzoquinol methylase
MSVDGARSAGGAPPLRPAACYLCGSAGLDLLIVVEGCAIWRCPECGLGETHRHSSGRLGASPDRRGPAPAYDRAYLETLWTGADPSPSEVERAVRAELPRARRLKRFAGGKRLLEIGVGHGYFLAAAQRRGFDCCGIDVSDAAAEFARRRFGHDVLVSAVEDASLPQASFDAIAVWHVLEHLGDPRCALRKAAAWLKPGGVIALEVPNYESYDARVLGAQWKGWQPRYHHWHFTPRALARLLTGAGFVVEQTWSDPSRTARERLKRIPIIGLFRRVLWRFYSSTGVAMLARRVRPDSTLT